MTLFELVERKLENLCVVIQINPLSAKFIKWSNTLKQFVGKLPTNCLSVFDHFSGLALKGLTSGLRKAFLLIIPYFIF